MMKCQKCNLENIKNAIYCRYCGTKLSIPSQPTQNIMSCWNCGNKLNEGAKFCKKCRTLVPVINETKGDGDGYLPLFASEAGIEEVVKFLDEGKGPILVFGKTVRTGSELRDAIKEHLKGGKK